MSALRAGRVTRRVARAFGAVALGIVDGCTIVPGFSSFTAGWPRSRVFLGRAVPSLEGSFASNVRFLDRFRLTMMIDFKSGYRKLDNNLRARCQVFRTCLENMDPEKYDPKLIAQMQSSGTLRDFVINDAKFAKLREISLSYDAPPNYASRIGARSVSFSVAARNLHTWTGYSGADPEDMFLSGTPNFLEQSNLPQLASFVFTTNVSF